MVIFAITTQSPCRGRPCARSVECMICRRRAKFGDPGKPFRVRIAESDYYNFGEVFGGRPGASGVEVPAAGLYLGEGGSG
jgi:hypothetical protein